MALTDEQKKMTMKLRKLSHSMKEIAAAFGVYDGNGLSAGYHFTMIDAKEDLIKLLNSFDVETLTEDGISARHEALESEGLESTIGNIYRDLYDIQDRFKLLSQGERVEVLPKMFDLIERAGDLDIGSGAPGPITHAIESTSEFYLPLLFESLRRQPTPSSLLMVNRWANSLETVDDLLPFLAEIEKAAAHPKASVRTREDAMDYLNHQKSRLR